MEKHKKGKKKKRKEVVVVDADIDIPVRKKKKKKSGVKHVLKKKKPKLKAELLDEEPLEIVEVNETGRMGILSRIDKQLAQSLLQFGEVAFDEQGFDDNDRLDWLARPEIKQYLQNLEEQIQDRASQLERVRFFTLFDLSRTSRYAVKILTDAMMGEHEDENGQVARPPSNKQIDAAKSVLNFIGVDGKNAGAIGISSSNVVLFADHDEYPIDKPLRREAVRKKIDSFLYRIKQQVQMEMGDEGVDIPRLPNKNPEMSVEAERKVKKKNKTKTNKRE